MLLVSRTHPLCRFLGVVQRAVVNLRSWNRFDQLLRAGAREPDDLVRCQHNLKKYL